MRSLVISIFLYACESWTLTAELEKRTQAFEMRCYRRLLNISYKDHVTNEEVRRKIQAAIGEYDELLTLVKKRKLRWFGHVSRSSGLAKTILQGTVKGKRKRGRQKKRWEDNIKEWTGMDFASSTRTAENRSRWKGIVANSLVKKRKLRWFGHVSRSSGLAKTILQGTVKGKRKRGRQKKRWEDNIKEWTGMDFASSTRTAENRSRWKGIVANSSVVPRRPSKVMG